MQRVLAAAAAVFLQFHSAGIVTTILLRRVIALFAFGAGERDHGADIFLLRCHVFSLSGLPAEHSSFFKITVPVMPTGTAQYKSITR